MTCNSKNRYAGSVPATTDGAAVAGTFDNIPKGFFNMKRNIILLIFLSVVVFNSCQPKREEYTANIKIINNSNSVINKFTLKAAAEEKIIENLQLNENYEFEVKWIGRSSSFLASMDNSFIFLEITYFIGDKIYDIRNEKGALIDSYGNYYSEKTITDGFRILIEINDDGYEIINEN